MPGSNWTYRSATRAGDLVTVTLINVNLARAETMRLSKQVIGDPPALETEAQFVARARGEIGTSLAMLNANDGLDVDVTSQFRPTGPINPGG